MKRSTGKKTERTAAKELESQGFDDSAWYDVMRATLSPYWSARLEYTSGRDTRREEDEQDAA